MSGKPPQPILTFPPQIQQKIKEAEEVSRRAFLEETDPVKKNELYIQSKLMKMNALREHKEYRKKVGTEGIAHPGTIRRKVHLKGGRRRRTLKHKQLKRK